jgi:hypothetical protein
MLSDIRQLLNNEGMLEFYYGPRGQAYQTTAGASVTRANAAAANAAANTTRAGAYAGGYMTAAQQKAAAAAANAATNKTKARADVTRANAYANAENAKARSGGFTPAQVAHFNGTATNIADVAFHGGTGAKGQALSPLNYQQAQLEMQKAGIPPTIAAAALAKFYAPGQRGRPLPPMSKADQAAAHTFIPGNPVFNPFSPTK